MITSASCAAASADTPLDEALRHDLEVLNLTEAGLEEKVAHEQAREQRWN
jgi:hypothetical protein